MPALVATLISTGHLGGLGHYIDEFFNNYPVIFSFILCIIFGSFAFCLFKILFNLFK